MPNDRDRGFVLFYRKFWDNLALKEPGKPYSKREAWLDIFSNLASGVDGNGFLRGEFDASIRFLSKRWNWDKNKVCRFLDLLEDEMMIQKKSCNSISSGQQTGQQTGHFIICSYSTYQDSRDSKRDSKRDKVKEGIIKQGIIKEKLLATEQVFLTMILKSGNEFQVTENYVLELEKTFPKTDVRQELALMKIWCETHPEKRKTESGMPRFISGWLAREFRATTAQQTIGSLNFGKNL